MSKKNLIVLVVLLSVIVLLAGVYFWKSPSQMRKSQFPLPNGDTCQTDGDCPWGQICIAAAGNMPQFPVHIPKKCYPKNGPFPQ